MNARLGDAAAPLLVSVRSGARASMPGMMDTILNLGLNDAVAEGLARAARTPASPTTPTAASSRCTRASPSACRRSRSTTRSTRRAAAVAESKGIDRTRLNAEELKRKRARRRPPGRGAEGAGPGLQGHREEGDRARLPDRSARAALAGHRGRLRARGTTTAPSSTAACTTSPTPGAPRATCRRWSSATWATPAPRASRSRAIPSTGEKLLYGEWLPERAGRGRRRRHPHAACPSARSERRRQRARRRVARGADARGVRRARLASATTLEKHFRDMQDLEFTIQGGKLYMLQCRGAKRAARAAVRDRGRHGAARGSSRRKRPCCASIPAGIDQLLHPTLDPNAPKKLLARGLSASPGAASGHIVFNADEAERRAGQGKPVILVRVETSPEDIHGMKAARGILTARGGMTSHAAVVARGMGKPCVAGVSADRGELRVADDDRHGLRRRRPADRERHAQEGRRHHHRRRHGPRLRGRRPHGERRALAASSAS